MYLACIVLTFKSMDGQNPMMQHEALSAVVS